MDHRSKRSFPCRPEVVLEGMTARGLTQAKLAARAGVSVKTIERLFAGRGISRSLIQAIAGAIGSTFDDVVAEAVESGPPDVPRTLTFTLQATCIVPSSSLTPELSDIGRQLISQLQARGILVTAQAHVFSAADPTDNFVRRLAQVMIQPDLKGPALGWNPASSYPLQLGFLSYVAAIRPSRYYDLLDTLAVGPIPIATFNGYGELITSHDSHANDVLLRDSPLSLPDSWHIKSMSPRQRHGMPVFASPDRLDSLLRRRSVSGTPL